MSMLPLFLNRATVPVISKPSDLICRSSSFWFSLGFLRPVSAQAVRVCPSSWAGSCLAGCSDKPCTTCSPSKWWTGCWRKTPREKLPEELGNIMTSGKMRGNDGGHCAQKNIGEISAPWQKQNTDYSRSKDFFFVPKYFIRLNLCLLLKQSS